MSMSIQPPLSPDNGDPRHATNLTGTLPQSATDAYSDQPKAPQNYTLVYKHPSWLLRVAKDKRTRTGAEYQEFFADFTGNVRTYGVLQPIIAVREGEAARTIEGESRRLAALIAGLETVPILVYESALSESELIIAQLVSNAQRKDFTEHELAAIYVQLMAINNWTQLQVAEFVNVSPAKVSKVLSISKNLAEACQTMMLAGDLPPRAAYALSRLPDQAKQLELAKKYDVVYSVEGIEAEVSKLLGEKPSKPKAWTLKVGNSSATVRGNLTEELEKLIVRLKDALKRIKDSHDPNLAVAN